MDREIIDLVNPAEKIILYGAATCGARVYYNLLEIGVNAQKIVFFDSNPVKQGMEFLGRPILDRSQFDALERDSLILISSSMYYEIEPDLERQRFNNFHYFHELLFSRKQFEKYPAPFKALVEKIPYRTLNDDEFYTLYHSALALKEIPGAFAEVGVYKGGSAFLLASVSLGKQLYLFDTFKGLPSGEALPANKLFGLEPKGGWLSNTDEKTVRALVLSSGIDPHNVHIRPGYFPTTTADLHDEVFSLVHVDADLYQTTIDALNFFYPRMSVGGRFITHDYNASGCPGVRKAFDDYFAKRGHFIVEVSESQAIAIKC